MEIYRGIRFNREKGKVEGFDTARWISSLSGVIDLLDDKFTSRVGHAGSETTDSEKEGVGFRQHHTEVFLGEGPSRRFFDTLQYDSTIVRAAKEKLHRKLADLVGYMYIYTYVAQSIDTDPKAVPVDQTQVVEEESKSAENPKTPNIEPGSTRNTGEEVEAMLISVTPSSIEIFDSSDALNQDDEPEPHKVYKLKILLPNYSDAESFYPCFMEFGEHSRDQRRQKKIWFPSSAPSFNSGPDLLAHLGSEDYLILRKIFATLLRFSREHQEDINANWMEFGHHATVLQGDFNPAPSAYLPQTISAIIRTSITNSDTPESGQPADVNRTP